jgi:hypothetical protein
MVAVTENGTSTTRTTEADTLVNLEDSDYIRQLLGNDLYFTILGKQYPHEAVTSERRPVHRSTYIPMIDMNLSAFTSEFQLFSVREEDSSRWYVSIFGNFGAEQINLPLWARGTGSVGVRVKHRSDNLPRSRDYDGLSIHLGWEEPANFSVPAGSPFQTVLKQPKLVGASSNVFFKMMYVPDWDLAEKGYFEGGLEASLAVIQKNRKEIPARLGMEFYSMKNYVTVSAAANQIANWIDAGAGVTVHDIYRLTRKSNAILLDPISQTTFCSPFFELGISQQWDLLQFSLGGRFNWHPGGSNYWAWNGRETITNSFGIDFRYHIATATTLADWQSKDYIVVSPIIHFSY